MTLWTESRALSLEPSESARDSIANAVDSIGDPLGPIASFRGSIDDAVDLLASLCGSFGSAVDWFASCRDSLTSFIDSIAKVIDSIAKSRAGVHGASRAIWEIPTPLNRSAAAGEMGGARPDSSAIGAPRVNRRDLRAAGPRVTSFRIQTRTFCRARERLAGLACISRRPTLRALSALPSAPLARGSCTLCPSVSLCPFVRPKGRCSGLQREAPKPRSFTPYVGDAREILPEIAKLA
jgi:hypothetical protein